MNTPLLIKAARIKAELVSIITSLIFFQSPTQQGNLASHQNGPQDSQSRAQASNRISKHIPDLSSDSQPVSCIILDI